MAKEIKQQNAQGVFVEELQPVEIVSNKQVEKEPEFVELVGQISLKSLDRNNNRRNKPSRDLGDRNKNNQNSQGFNKNRGQQRPPQSRPPQGRKPHSQ